MAEQQAFWRVDAEEGEPDLWVCLSCLSEVFRRKVPQPDCPTCHGVSTYEAFTLEAIKDWGSEALIARAEAAQAESVMEPAPAEARPVSDVSE